MYDELGHILEARRRQAEHDAELARFLAAVDTWARGRAAALRAQHADRLTAAALLLEENQVWWERQQRLVVLHGFFDDSLAAAFVGRVSEQTFTGADGKTRHCVSVEGLLPDTIRAILEVADDINLETAAHKIEVGTDDGRTGKILIEAWRQDCAAGLPVTSRRILWELRPGSMVALGKELDLQRQRVVDTAQRVDALTASIERLNAAANLQTRHGRPTAPIPALRSVIGQSFYCCQSEPWLRSALNVPLRSLRVLESLYPRLEREYRASKRRHKGVPWFSWTYHDPKAQAALLDFAAGAALRRGVPFNQTDSTPGAEGRSTIWIIQDASGSEGGGGGALYMPVTGADLLPPGELTGPGETPLRWSYDAFDTDQTAASSTEQEASNANANLQRALDLGFMDVIEVLDNSAWVFIARSGACRSAALSDLTTSRSQLLQQYDDARVYSVWQPREQGTLPDGISKLHLSYAAPPSSLAGPTPPAGWTGRSWVDAELRARGHPAGLSDKDRLL